MLLVAIAVSVLFGIVGVLADGLGKTALHVWLTSVVVSGASLLVLAQLGAWDLGHARIVSRGGVIVTAISAVVWIAAVWLEPRSDEFWQCAASCVLFAIASAHACILGLARIPPRANAVRAAALACDVLIVVLMLAGIWSDFDDRGTGQFLAVLAILETGMTVAVGAIATASRSTPVAGDVAEVCFCVHCGKSLWVPAGEVRCRHCDATFFVELRDVKDLPGAVLR